MKVWVFILIDNFIIWNALYDWYRIVKLGKGVNHFLESVLLGTSIGVLVLVSGTVKWEYVAIYMLSAAGLKLLQYDYLLNWLRGLPYDYKPKLTDGSSMEDRILSRFSFMEILLIKMSMFAVVIIIDLILFHYGTSH